MTKNLPNSQLCNQLPWTVRWYGDACAARYGEAYPVIKEECTGHVQKRMGGGLHKLKRKRRVQKLSDGKGVGGTGRLTEGMIDWIQNIQNSDIDSMKKAINAILHHMIKDDTMSLAQQHMYCPRHGKTWCKVRVPTMKVPDYQLYSKQNYVHYLIDFQSSVTTKG